MLLGGPVDKRYPDLGPAVLYSNVSTGDALKAALEKMKGVVFLPEVTPVKTLTGKGFICISANGSSAVEEYDNVAQALEAAETNCGPTNPIIVYEPVAVVRPKKDVVAQLTERGSKLADEAQRRVARSLGSGEVSHEEAPDPDAETPEERDYRLARRQKEKDKAARTAALPEIR